MELDFLKIKYRWIGQNWKTFWDYATFKEYEDNSAAIDAVYDEIFNQPIYRGDTDPSRGPGLANGNMNKIYF